MHYRNTVIAILLYLLCLQGAFAQRSNSGKNHYTRKNHSYKAPVAGSKAKIECPVFEISKYPYHGIGFKFGDPLALTYKYYRNKNFSIAVDFGRASSSLYNRYYREKFSTESQAMDTLSDNSSLTYSGHRIVTDLIGELKVLYHFDAGKISPGLQMYAGAGWEWKNTSLRYEYFYNRKAPDGTELINEFRTTPRHRFTMGPQIVLGIEYAYFQLPISAFIEVEYFTDVQADPGWRRFEGGVGLRYVF